MTLGDRLGRYISGHLYRYAKKHPGRPGLTSYSNYARFNRFNRRWPWSWRPESER